MKMGFVNGLIICLSASEIFGYECCCIFALIVYRTSDCCYSMECSMC